MAESKLFSPRHKLPKFDLETINNDKDHDDYFDREPGVQFVRAQRDEKDCANRALDTEKPRGR